MASEWHKKIQKEIMEEFEGYSVKKERKIGFESKITRKTQFKIVDIVAEKGDEIVLIEIEDHKEEKREYGVKYVELGGILLLSWLFSKLERNKNKKITLLLIFRENIVHFRRENIEKIISEFKEICTTLEIQCQYMP